MAVRPSSSPPRPRRVTQIGVTGHRLNRIAPEMARSLPHECERVLHAIASASGCVREPGATGEKPASLRVISPLAEGADRIVARAGMALGAELQCPLPFPAEDYKQDFESAASREEFDALLAQASSVLVAGGDRKAEDTAYERAGQIVVQQSDVLIAIWDGEPSRGRGGTAQMVEEALELGIPVVWLHAMEPVEPRVLWADETGNQIAEPFDRLAEVLSGACPGRPKRSGAGAEPDSSDQDRTYFAEKHPRLNPGCFFTWFRDLVVNGRLLPGSMRLNDFEEAARREWQESMAAGESLPEETRRYLLDRLCPHYAWADGLSAYYAGIFRSGSVIANLFAASAVLFALIGPLADSMGFKLNRLPSLLEFALITAVLAIIFTGQRRKWHQRWLEYRQLAERLRQTSFLAPLGCTLVAPRQAPHLGSDPSGSWVDAMFHAITRDIGMAPGKVDSGYIRAVGGLIGNVLQGQIRYHHRNHERLEKLNHRLHRIGNGLFAVTLLACVAHVLLGGEDPWLLVLATAPPALGAALYAITSQGEFARSSDRSLAMAHELAHLREVELPEALAAAGETFEELRNVARNVADVMISETNDWNIVFKYRPLNLPG